jgi:hypothetical protein
MTSATIAAELELILTGIADTLYSETASRQSRLEDVETRLADVTTRLRSADCTPPVAEAMTPGQLADRLTARLDGPHADEDTTGAAHLAAETIRFLNYATGSHAGQGLTYPATVYAITGSLSRTAALLPQLCGQLACWLDAEHAAGRLGDDRGGPVAVLTDRARHDLDQAARFADALARALAQTQSAVATVHSTRGRTA